MQIKDLPYELTSVNGLVNFLTRFLWQISVQHAAINYPLADYGAFTLNMPTKLYRDSRVSDDVFSMFNYPNANISAVRLYRWSQNCFRYFPIGLYKETVLPNLAVVFPTDYDS